MKAYTTLYDDVLPECPGCDPALALHHIKRTCNDFYERSLYAREVATPINVVAGTATYTVPTSAPNDFDVAKVIEVRLANASSSPTRYAKLDPRTPEQLDLEYPNWDVKQGTPKFYTQRALDSVTLAWVPDTSLTGGLVVTIAKLPLYGGGGIDDVVHSKFAEALGWGAKARLMAMPKKPWSNPQVAKDYADKFEKEVAAAAAIAGHAFGRAPLRSRAWG